MGEGGENYVALEVHDAVLIVNPQAGGGRKVRQLDEARRIFRKAGIETELQNTSAPGEATEFARQAVAQSRQLVIVCGGDGTVNEAVNGLACSQVPLAVLTGRNGQCPCERVVASVEFAPRRRTHPDPSEISPHRIGSGDSRKSSGEPRYFVSLAGAGPDGAIVAAVRPEIKLRAGIIAYWHEGLKQLTAYNFPRFRVTTGDLSIDATLVIVGRTKHYGGPFKITTDADLHRPEFELAFVTTRSAWRYIAYLPLIWAGRLRGARHVHFCKATSLHCVAIDSSPVLIQVDGEPAGRLPAEFRIVPDALTLAMPDPL